MPVYYRRILIILYLVLVAVGFVRYSSPEIAQADALLFRLEIIVDHLGCCYCRVFFLCNLLLIHHHLLTVLGTASGALSSHTLSN